MGVIWDSIIFSYVIIGIKTVEEVIDRVAENIGVAEGGRIPVGNEEVAGGVVLGAVVRRLLNGYGDSVCNYYSKKIESKTLKKLLILTITNKQSSNL